MVTKFWLSFVTSTSGVTCIKSSKSHDSCDDGVRNSVLRLVSASISSSGSSSWKLGSRPVPGRAVLFLMETAVSPDASATMSTDSIVGDRSDKLYRLGVWMWYSEPI